MQLEDYELESRRTLYEFNNRCWFEAVEKYESDFKSICESFNTLPYTSLWHRVSLHTHTSRPRILKRTRVYNKYSIAYR